MCEDLEESRTFVTTEEGPAVVPDLTVEEALELMTAAMLKAECKRRELRLTGKKSDLVERLLETEGAEWQLPPELIREVAVPRPHLRPCPARPAINRTKAMDGVSVPWPCDLMSRRVV